MNSKDRMFEILKEWLNLPRKEAVERFDEFRDRMVEADIDGRFEDLDLYRPKGLFGMEKVL